MAQGLLRLDKKSVLRSNNADTGNIFIFNNHEPAERSNVFKIVKEVLITYIEMKP